MKLKQFNLKMYATLVAVLACAQGAWGYDFIDREYGIWFNLIDNGASVTWNDYDDGTNYGSYSGSVTIPSQATMGLPSSGNLFPVIEIGPNAFRKSTGLTYVYIPNSVTNIANYAFYQCTGLTSVTIPNSVTNIGNSAFSLCSNLRNVNIPNAVVTLGNYAFAYCKMTSVTIPSTTTSITGDTFLGCDQLTSMVVASGNTVFDSRNNCNAIIRTSTNTLIAGCKNTSIPNNVTAIGMSAFSYHTGLGSINTGNSVTSIGNYAFYNCTGLSSISMGSGTTSIGSYTFYYCPNLTSVTCLAMTPPSIQSTTFTSEQYSNATVTVPGPWALSKYKAANYWKNFTNIVALHPYYDFYYDGLYYLITSDNTCKVTYKNTDYNSYSGSVTIPSTVTYGGKTYRVTGIGDNAFRMCSDLTNVTIGSNVTEIGTAAFHYCTSLTSIGIPASVTTIKSSAFSYSALTKVIIPNSVTTIGWNAFGDISTLTSVVIGSGCTSLDSFTFDSPLTKVTCLATTPPTMYSYNCFKTTTYSSATLYVPAASVNAYKAEYGWMNFTNIQSLPTLDNALNVSGGNIHFLSTGNYPWMVIVENGRSYAQSGNAGVHSTTSTMTATVTVTKASTVSFDFKAWGEGSNYDVSIFSIDGVQQFKYGARQNDWETYSADLNAGTHTLTWTYQKDSSVNPTGDYFAVDNVKVIAKPNVQHGDVDGNGAIGMDDLTALINYLVYGTTSGINMTGADVDGNGTIGMDDLTALINYLVYGHF